MSILTREEEYDKEKGEWVVKKKGLKDYLTRDKTDMDKKIAEFEKKQKLQNKLDQLKKTHKKTETDKLKQQIKKYKKQKHEKTYKKIKNYGKKSNELLDTIFGPTSKTTKKKRYDTFGTPIKKTGKNKPVKTKTKYIIRNNKAFPIAQPKNQKPKTKKKKKKQKKKDIFNPSGMDWGF